MQHMQRSCCTFCFERRFSSHTALPSTQPQRNNTSLALSLFAIPVLTLPFCLCVNLIVPQQLSRPGYGARAAAAQMHARRVGR